LIQEQKKGKLLFSMQGGNQVVVGMLCYAGAADAARLALRRAGGAEEIRWSI